MANYLCDFGNVHDCAKTCECPLKYRMFAGTFRHNLNRMFGKWVEEDYRGKKRTVMNVPVYSEQITPHMRDSVIAAVKGGVEGTYESTEARNPT